VAQPWERLYRDRYDQLVREAQALVRDRTLAEDLAQDAFERLIQADLKDPGHAWAWLRVVVKNRARDHFRREETAARAVPDDRGAAPSAESEALHHIDHGRVRVILGSLESRDRDALWLRHQGASYREIAKATGIPDSQVGVVLLRAMKKFRRAYSAASDREDQQYE
jgi:RNA polymerase sigma factor (sigma-70 family)